MEFLASIVVIMAFQAFSSWLASIHGPAWPLHSPAWSAASPTGLLPLDPRLMINCGSMKEIQEERYSKCLLASPNNQSSSQTDPVTIEMVLERFRQNLCLFLATPTGKEMDLQQSRKYFVVFIHVVFQLILFILVTQRDITNKCSWLIWSCMRFIVVILIDFDVWGWDGNSFVCYVCLYCGFL